jgi:hypothetical protein
MLIFFFAKFNSGEIPSIHHVKGQRGDGIGFTIDSNKYQIIYVEGSCPYNIKEQKEIGDRIKIARNLKKMFFDIVKDRVEKRKVMIPEMEVFGAASVKLNIHTYVLGFAGNSC